MNNQVKVFTRAEQIETGESKLSKVIEYSNGQKTEIPINKDGGVKWFDDTKLLKTEK